LSFVFFIICESGPLNQAEPSVGDHMPVVAAFGLTRPRFTVVTPEKA
jgi:hypothetical protein